MLYILRLMLCYHWLYVVIWCCLFTIYWSCLVQCIYCPALSLLDAMYFMPFDAMNYLHWSRVSCFYVVWPSLVAIQVSIQWSKFLFSGCTNEYKTKLYYQKGVQCTCTCIWKFPKHFQDLNNFFTRDVPCCCFHLHNSVLQWQINNKRSVRQLNR